MKKTYDPYFFLTTESLRVELRSYHRKIMFRDEVSIYDNKKLVELFTTLLLKYGIDVREIAKRIDLTKEIYEMKETTCPNCKTKIELNKDMTRKEKTIICPNCFDKMRNPLYRSKNGV